MPPREGLGLASGVRETDTAAADDTLTRIGNALTGNVTEVPQFDDNPLGAIGFVLSNFAAGIQGSELPTERIRRAGLQQRQLDLQQLRVTLDAVKEGVDLFIGLDPEDPRTSAAINRFTEQFVPILGEGFRESLNAGLELARDQGREAIEGLVEHRERIQALCGLDRDCIQEAASNAALMQQFNDTADQQRLPGIIAKFDVIGEIVGDEAVEALREDGFSLSDLRRLPGDFAFTSEEIRTISRSKDIQDALIPLGFQPPDVDRLALETATQEGIRSTFRPTAAAPNLTFREIEEGDEKFVVGLDPRTGREVSRMRSGVIEADEPPNLTFREIDVDGSKFIVGLDPRTGREVSRISSGASGEAPNLQFREVERDGRKFIVGLDPRTGREVSRVPAGQASDSFNATELKAALSLQMLGESVEGTGINQTVVDIVRDLTPEQASEMRAGLESGGMEIITTDEGTSIRTGAAIRAARPTAEQTEAGVRAREGASNIATFSSLLGELERVGPGAGGIRALVGSAGAGLLGQINQGLAEGFSEVITGASPAEITSIRQRARAVIAQSITQLSGEESGRFTEAERQMTAEALRLLEPGASFEQIRAALGTAVSLAYTARDKNEIVAGIEPRFDLGTDQGRRALMEELIIDLGLTMEEAMLTLENLQLQRRLMRESGGR